LQVANFALFSSRFFHFKIIGGIPIPLCLAHEYMCLVLVLYCVHFCFSFFGITAQNGKLRTTANSVRAEF